MYERLLRMSIVFDDLFLEYTSDIIELDSEALKVRLKIVLVETVRISQ